MRMKDAINVYLSMKKKVALRGFLWHLGSYILISLVVAFWNHYYGNYPWHIWMIFGWGFGILSHGIAVMFLDIIFYRRASRIDFENMDDFVKKYAELVQKEEAKGFKRHLSIYIIANAFTIVLNLLLYPKYFFFPFVLLGWGIGIYFHYLGIRNLKDRIIRDFKEVEKLVQREIL